MYIDGLIEPVRVKKHRLLPSEIPSDIMLVHLDAAMLDSNDFRFLKKRKTFSRTWNFVGIGLLLALGALFLWLFFKTPNMVNPFYVVSQIKADTLENATLLLMAILFPITVCFFIFITAICIIFGFAVFANERRYIRIIENLVRDLDKPKK